MCRLFFRFLFLLANCSFNVCCCLNSRAIEAQSIDVLVIEVATSSMGHRWTSHGTSLNIPWDIARHPLGHRSTSLGTSLDIPWDQGGQIKNSKFRNFFFKIRKSSELFYEKSEINQNEEFFCKLIDIMQRYYHQLLCQTFAS